MIFIAFFFSFCLNLLVFLRLSSRKLKTHLFRKFTFFSSSILVILGAVISFSNFQIFLKLVFEDSGVLLLFLMLIWEKLREAIWSAKVEKTELNNLSILFYSTILCNSHISLVSVSVVLKCALISSFLLCRIWIGVCLLFAVFWS